MAKRLADLSPDEEKTEAAKRVCRWRLTRVLEQLLPPHPCLVHRHALQRHEHRHDSSTRGRQSISVPQNPVLVVDAGVENLNKDVDELIEAGWLSRVVALRDVVFSNSMIEAFWRTLKHQWLYLNTLDTPEAVRRLVAFYINAHNTELPHAAFCGETPDEMYFGTGNDIPNNLDMAKKRARAARIAANQAVSCTRCRPDPEVNRPIITIT